MFGSKKKQQAQNLMATGTRAVGTITHVRDTGMTVNDNPRVSLTFRIEPLDGSPGFEGSKKATVSRVQVPQVGQRYPVWFDAADHSLFAYATVDDDNGRAQIAALFPGAFGADGSGVGMVAAAAPSAATSATDVAERIRQLDVLKAAGVIDDAEYADQKARILAAL
ncbi:MAG: hypothetical protein JWO02_180 [Solirubrobacterales bacterium]|nr:hypothetical protein [Solirubrobacterales bacterium]